MNDFFDENNQYLLQPSFCYSTLLKPTLSLANSHDNILTHQTKLTSQTPNPTPTPKTKYIQKLKQYPHTLSQQHILQSNHSILSLNKRQRNRRAAQQSRARKKLYIELTKYQYKKLENQLNAVLREIEETKQKINKFCSNHKTTMGFATRNQLQAKLEHILDNKQTQSTNQQISIVLDSMSFRMGATGRQRLQKQNQCYTQIINLSLPPLHRYLLWTTTQSKHIFSNKNTIDEHEQFKCKLPIPIDNLQQHQQTKLATVKRQISSRKQQLLTLVTQLLYIKTNIQNLVKDIEAQINTLRDILSPVQAAKFTLLANNNKYYNYFSFFREDQREYAKIYSAQQKKIKRQ